MLPIPLAEKVAELLTEPDISATERAILKMTASMILYNRLGYTGLKDIGDERIRLAMEEMFWMPGRMEVWDGLAVPKDWETPEILDRVKKEKQERAALITELVSQGHSEDDASRLLEIRDLHSTGAVFLHPVTREEMTDETTILRSSKEHKTLVFKELSHSDE